jgi:radical SAM superfamily enzyme
MTIENTQKQDLTDEYLIALKRAQAELFGLVKQAREMREAASSTEKEIQRKVRLARSIIESLPKETMKKQFEEVSRLISLLSNDGRTSSTFDLVRKHIAEKKHGHIQSAELVNAPEQFITL